MCGCWILAFFGCFSGFLGFWLRFFEGIWAYFGFYGVLLGILGGFGLLWAFAVGIGWFSGFGDSGFSCGLCLGGFGVFFLGWFAFCLLLGCCVFFGVFEFGLVGVIVGGFLVLRSMGVWERWVLSWGCGVGDCARSGLLLLVVRGCLLKVDLVVLL